MRALAVLSVFAFHLSSAVLPGGFVGVDLFFVISGYLITGHIVRSVDAKAFSFAEFYARRARRILPALLIVSMLVLAIGAVLLLPVELVRLCQSIAYAIMFSANIFFYQHSRYFDLKTAD